MPWNTILFKVKLCKTFQGKEDGDSSSLRLIPQFKKTLKGNTGTVYYKTVDVVSDCYT